MDYAFCESVTASGTSPWHIRELSEQGLKLGGGIDRSSFCGCVKPPHGWDLRAEITDKHLGHACKECASEYRKRTDLGKSSRHC